MLLTDLEQKPLSESQDAITCLSKARTKRWKSREMRSGVSATIEPHGFGKLVCLSLDLSDTA